MNNRRKLLVALGASALSSPFFAFAQPQPGRVWRVGFLSQRQLDFVDADPAYGPFRLGMRELGYIEGKNVIFEERFAEFNPERLPGMAEELVQLKVDVIVSGSPPATRAAQKATSTIPIVMLADSDPVGNGFVASLARPGGNITGLSTLGLDISPKHLEMLRSMVPKLSRVAFLMNPDNSVGQASLLKTVLAAGEKTGIKIQAFDVRVPQEFENAFAQMVRWKAGGLIVARGPFLNSHLRPISELAAKHRLPAISGLTQYVEAGGLISYGPSLADMFRRGATYVDKIFKGAKPADLPVEQPTIFELFINGKTAKALGLKIPQSLLISADKVLE